MAAKEIPLYTDLDLAFIANPRTGDLTPKVNSAAVQRSVNNLIRLEPFDIPFKPTYQSGMRQYLFQTFTRIDSANIKKDVESAIKKLEPRIKVQKVEVDSSEPQQVILTVFFSNESLNTEGSFNLIVERVR